MKIATWFAGYDRSWLRFDVIAGLTVWALVVPQSIAYAKIAGLPPQAGVFASFAAPLGYALLGTSRQLIVSPTSATAAISASLVAPLVINDPNEFAATSAALAVATGVVFLLLAWFKLGFVSQFIATGVQTGFLVGLGMTIIIGQLFDVFGIPKGNDGAFYKQFWDFITHLGETQFWTLAVGGGALVTLAILGKRIPTFPAALAMVGAGILLVRVFGLEDHGVAVVGSVDRAFPTPVIPTIPFDNLLVLIPGTLAIVLIGYSESISIAQGFADEHDYRIDGNRELAALGVSAAAGGFFQGFITCGGASQSAANDRAGARTQFAGVVLAILAALTAVLLMPLFQHLPVAVLAAIVISAVSGFVNLPAIQRLRSLRRDSFLAAMVALIGVLVLGILPGLLITVASSIIYLLTKLSKPQSSVMEQAAESDVFIEQKSTRKTRPVPGLLALRFDAPLMFINATWMRDTLRESVEDAEQQINTVVLDLSMSSDLDIKSLDTVSASYKELQKQGVSLWLANLTEGAHKALVESAVIDTIGPEHVFDSLELAEDAYETEKNVQAVPQGPR